MKPAIIEVSTAKQLSDFITFPEKLYKDCDNWVPALRGDEFDTLSGDCARNAAMEFCERILFLAYDDGHNIVGRIAGIINHKANKEWKTRVVRFGWMDFINDEEVAVALLGAVKKWGALKGMDTVKGPLGFTDIDREGMLVEGFENLSPFTCIYNYPYYPEILERIGFSKDADWVQMEVDIPSEVPQILKYSTLVEERFGLHVAKASSMRELGKRYGRALFHLVNESFAPLYEFSPLSDTQIDRYLKTYIPILDLDFVCVIVDDDDRVVGFCFCVPSLAKAVKKSGGRLFPFGVLRILRALRKNDTLEALMIGVSPEYQRKGATALIFKFLQENCNKRGIKRLWVNPMLEKNYDVRSIWG
ncbi:MAG: GNAT family N-acetyltransferase, partial [Alistipes sp.]|nr:GNAT family N-acetyltransferase [Candidatus Minthomonas equi]